MNAAMDRTGDLVLDHVSYQPGPLLLDDVSVTFAAGRVTALSGPSGSGKTTLLSIAGGLVAPSTGAATYDGRATWQGDGDPPPEIAFVLQVYGLVPILSARENVAIALRAEAERGCVVVIATHDPAIVELADHHVAIDEGRIA